MSSAPHDPFYSSPFGPFYRRHTPYMVQPEYRIYEMNKRLQSRTEVSGPGSGGNCAGLGPRVAAACGGKCPATPCTRVCTLAAGCNSCGRGGGLVSAGICKGDDPAVDSPAGALQKYCSPLQNSGCASPVSVPGDGIRGFIGHPVHAAK